jgi:hypothetical protein
VRRTRSIHPHRQHHGAASKLGQDSSQGADP